MIAAHSQAKTSQSDVNTNLENSCKDCDEVFVAKSDLMKHRKEQHMEHISKCRDFKSGKCSWNSSSCWFIHEDENMEIDNEEQVFREDLNKQPPDQMNLMMKMINKLMTQMEMLQKQTMP